VLSLRLKANAPAPANAVASAANPVFNADGSSGVSFKSQGLYPH